MCRHRPLTYCEIFCETGILAPVEEWGHFVAASRKIGNFDKWVVIWGVEVKDVGKVESKKISVKLGGNIGKFTISNSLRSSSM